MSKHILAAAMAATFGAGFTSIGFCSMSDDLESEVFSLADIADLDASDIQEMRFSTLPAGIYTFKTISAALGERDNRDNKPRVIPTFKFEVVEVKTAKVPKDFDVQELVGKTHQEKVYLVPNEGPLKLAESVGRLKAFIWDMGVDEWGKVQEMLDRCEDNIFDGQIISRANPNDKTSPFAQLKLAPRKR